MEQGHYYISEQSRDFCQYIEKCELDFQSLIKFGYVLYGQTKSGNTSIAHLLSGNKLKGVKIGGQQKVEIMNSINTNAKIGNTENTETRIPNLFKVGHPNQADQIAHVIDLPGYNNPHGIVPVLTGGYCHYKIYSRAQNMKFILCFDETQLRNTAELFIDTIAQFTSQFKDYQSQKEEIWKSCVFIINKVHEEQFTLQDLKQKLRGISKSIKLPKQESEINNIKQFINHIVENGKIIMVRKYKNGESIIYQDLLKTIDAKSLWFTREINIANIEEVDMSQIQIKLESQILVEVTKNQQSKRQLINLIELTNQRTLQLVNRETKENYSLFDVFDQLVKDAMGPPESFNFFNVIQSYVDKYYGLYAQDYEQKRKTYFKKNLCKKQQQYSAQQENVDVNYILKKFTALDEIEKTKDDYCNLDKFRKSKNQRLNMLLDTLHKIMIQLFNLCRTQSERTLIEKYWYLIYQFLKQSRILQLVIEYSQFTNRSENTSKKKIRQALDNKFILFLYEFEMGFGYYYIYDKRQITVKKLRRKYLKQLDLDSASFSEGFLNWAFLQFIMDISIQQCQQQQILLEKVILLILKYSDQFIKINLSQINGDLLVAESSKLIKKLVACRINSYQFIVLSLDEKQKNRWLFILRRITKNIAILLTHIKQYKLAREVYDSILFKDSIEKIFDLQQLQRLKKEQKELDKSAVIRWKIEYSNFLKDNFRMNLEIVLLQEQFELAEDQQNLQKTASMIRDEILNSNSNQCVCSCGDYQKMLNSELYYSSFSEELQKKLEIL